MAEALANSRETLRRLLAEQHVGSGRRIHDKVGPRLAALLTRLQEKDEERSCALAQLISEIDRDGLTQVARRIGYDPANLAAIRTGRRALPKNFLIGIQNVTGALQRQNYNV
ncbi:hypothetical protein [Methylobacterium goesingense]|uniref:Uncharacterized protein n=1 Tax=Methylobacterium goesingense TaxID=243690 RepID=A0ABV2LCV6_9HYPH|nr:hypothetical protein [Methylobacterium goesingense]